MVRSSVRFPQAAPFLQVRGIVVLFAGQSSGCWCTPTDLWSHLAGDVELYASTRRAPLSTRMSDPYREYMTVDISLDRLCAGCPGRDAEAPGP